ncbi:uncharacterized protein Z519_00429 [Cladophialophora bantiana CBS 173.52]|uniref:Clr5 domain-containing protein n=1 Tax=Cladophialophora bantiana (strain ATCC 10958 / CBS 173.52 / CDC B-1940 / NIH 8579) TaxID=1442370 RepID=A0A0D2F9K5_CLAB1|nr:uncharacterized protein Z519_00429 [Cladophialophora bantiana CBS 173.52]KIW98766.1 hypothetical protein Z519_00429 [Cladophialophora bantiana CBS 173.52]
MDYSNPSSHQSNMNYVERTTTMLPASGQAINQPSAFGINHDKTNTTSIQHGSRGMPNQEGMYTLFGGDGMRDPGMEDESYYMVAAYSQGPNHSAPVGFTYPVGNLDTTNQVPVDGFLCQETPGWLSNGVEPACFGLLQASGFWPRSVEFGTIDNTFDQGSFNNPLMFDQGSTFNQETSNSFDSRYVIGGTATMDGLEDAFNLCNVNDKTFQAYLAVIDDFDLAISQSGFSSGVNEHASSGALAMSDIEMISANHTQHQPRIPVQFRRYPPRRRRKDNSVEKPQPVERGNWERWRKALYHAYVEENRTMKEVVSEMSSILHFNKAVSTCRKVIKKWPEFRKNKIGEHVARNPRRRSAARLPKPPKTTNLLSLPKRVSTKPNAQLVQIPSILEEPYSNQRRMFNSINVFAQSLFGAKTRPWKYSTTTFTPPTGVTDSSAAWQLVLDTCLGIVTVSEGRVGGKVQFLLKNLFVALDAATQSRDPNFLSQFWRICVCLLRIRPHSRAHAKQFSFLRVFLLRLKGGFLKFCGNTKDPLVEFVDSLIRVLESSPRDLKATLGLTCSKAIETLGDMIGKEHFIVVNMTSDCLRHWNSMFRADKKLPEEPPEESLDSEISLEELLESRYQSLLRSCDPNEVDLQITLLYEYINAMSKGKYVSEIVAGHADQLRGLTVGRCRAEAEQNNLRHTLTTRAFAFSSELLAKYHLETWEKGRPGRGRSPDDISDLLDEAIEILRRGDIACQLQAAHCSRRLAVWFKTFYPGDKLRSKSHRAKGAKAQAEKRRTSEIMSCIKKEPCVIPREGLPVGAKRGSRNNRWRRKQIAERDLFLSALLKGGQNEPETDIR